MVCNLGIILSTDCLEIDQGNGEVFLPTEQDVMEVLNLAFAPSDSNESTSTTTISVTAPSDVSDNNVFKFFKINEQCATCGVMVCWKWI